MPASLTISTSNSSIFTDSQINDVILRSTLLNKNILIGNGSNNKSKLVINSNGIGIGTTSPVESLDIRGNMRISQNQYIYGNIGIGTNDTQSNQLYIIGNSYTTGTIRSSNVFIEGDLTVMGNNSIINTDVKITDQFIVSNAGYDTAVIIKQTGAQNSIEVYDDDKLAFIVADNGLVGINTNNPSTYLHVVGDTLLAGNTSINCNLNINGIVTCRSNVEITGNLLSKSNVNILGKMTCDSINNINLKYDVPDVSINNYETNNLRVNINLNNVLQDNDGFGNLIPNINKLYVLYSNNLLGSNIYTASNMVQNIKYINIFSGIENEYYSGTNKINDTYNISGIVTNSNYNISMYYENNRGKSVNNAVLNNISTTKIGAPSSVLNLSASMLSNNININFDTPLYTDSLSNTNTAVIKDYKMTYEAVDSIRHGVFSDINTYYSLSNNFKIEQYDSKLYIGTIYKLSVYAKNKSIDNYGLPSIKYIYTGFDSNNFDTGNNLNKINLIKQDSTSYYTYNTFYAIDNGLTSLNSNFISNDSNLLMSSLNSFYQETETSNLRLYYNPNPKYSNIGIITSTLSVTSNNTQILDTVNIIIKPFGSNNENIISNNSNISLQLKSLNTQNTLSNIGNDKLSNYFLKSRLNSVINYNSNVANNKINYSYNKYSLNTIVNLSQFTSWTQPSESNLLFNSTLCNLNINNGNIILNYYYDNIKNIGNPLLTNFGYSVSNLNKTYISGIPTGSNYIIDYAVNLSNVASYWTINPIITIQNSSNNSNIFNNTITTQNKYYVGQNGSNLYNNLNYNNTKSNITEINKATLSNGLLPYNYKLLFKENQILTMTSNNLLSNIDITMCGYNLINTHSSNISIGPIHFDSNSLNHPHILNPDSNNMYGIRLFADTSNILTYPSISNMSIYNNSSNIGISNYKKEAILYNGDYYGENTVIWKKNWITIDSNSYNYSTIGTSNMRMALFKYSKIDGTSTNLALNIVNNNYDDKQILIKYEIPSIMYESVWFSASNDFNGKNLIYNRSNGDGIKNTSKIDTINTKNIKCPGVEDLTIYILVNIPVTNLDNKLKYIYIS